VVAALPAITSRHHHVQRKEKAIFRSKEDFPESLSISPPVSLARTGHMFVSEPVTAKGSGSMTRFFPELGLGFLFPAHVGRKKCLLPPGPRGTSTSSLF